MLPFGHMGITVAAMRIIEKKFQLPGVDYRLLLVTSLLPDLIDKPISYLFNTYSMFTGVHYGHSLLFLAIVVIVTMVAQWYRQKSNWGVYLCIGVLSHDILDFISHHEEWTERKILNINILLDFEIIGVCILTYFLIGLVLPNKVEHFIKTGQL